MAVPIQPGATSGHGRPVPLFPAGPYFVNVALNYDVTPDGKGFIMVKTANTSEWQSIVVVTNWFDEVRAHMRAGPR